MKRLWKCIVVNNYEIFLSIIVVIFFAVSVSIIKTAQRREVEGYYRTCLKHYSIVECEVRLRIGAPP